MRTLGLDWVRNRCFTCWRTLPGSTPAPPGTSQFLLFWQFTKTHPCIRAAWIPQLTSKEYLEGKKSYSLEPNQRQGEHWSGNDGKDKSIQRQLRPSLWETKELQLSPSSSWRELLLAYTTFNQGCSDKSSQFISHSQFKRCHAQAMYLLTSVPPSKARQEEWC